MPLCGVSPKLPYCVVITSIFLKIWNGRESHQDIKACSKRQTASIVLFSGFPAWNHNVLQSFGYNREQHKTKTSDSDDCTVRSIVVVMKIRVSVFSLSKVQLRHPWQESIFDICKNAYTCLHILFFVRISHRRPSSNSHFVLLLLYIGFCHSRGTGVAGLNNVLLSRSADLMDLLRRDGG